MSVITFNVIGVPGPKGSKIMNRYGAMYEQSKAVKPWEAAVVKAATAEGDRVGLLEPLTPPYEVEVWFYFEKPRTSRLDAPVGKNGPGDVDKLARATLDPLVKAGLLVDDCHVTRIVAEKAWAGPNETPGAVIRVSERVSGR